MNGERCIARKADGTRCRAWAVSDSELCRVHDPAHAEGAAAARSLGGQHRRREGTIHATFDLPPLDSLDWPRRLAEIAASDLLTQENSNARSRALLYGASVGLRIIQFDQLETRLETVEAALRVRPQRYDRVLASDDLRGDDPEELS